MKYFAILFLLYTIGLICKPVLDMYDFDDEQGICSTSCCSSTQQEQPTDSDEDDCGGICNPFFSCCSCVGFVIPNISSLPQQPISKIIKESVFYHQSTPTLVAVSIWHPPKFA